MDKNVHRATLLIGESRIRIEACDTDALQSIIRALDTIGAVMAPRGRKPSYKEDLLAQAVAEHKHISYEKAKDWLDQKELQQRGFKLRVRREPAIAKILVRLQSDTGLISSLLDEIPS